MPRRRAHNFGKAFKYPFFIRRALKHKQALWHSGHTAGEMAYCKAQVLLSKKLIKNFYARAEKRLLNSKSISAFFKYVKRKLNYGQGIPHKSF